MAHHLISIIGQIAMMMKKCIIVHSMTHTANQPASLAAVCIQLRSEKRIRYSVIQEVLKDGSTLFHIVLMCFYKFNSVITINIVIDRLNWVKRLYRL